MIKRPSETLNSGDTYSVIDMVSAVEDDATLEWFGMFPNSIIHMPLTFSTSFYLGFI